MRKYLPEFLGANILDNEPFIVTPLMNNGNVRTYIQNHPDCDRLTMVCTDFYLFSELMTDLRDQLHHISLGIVYLHSQNIIHGDLKAVLSAIPILLCPSHAVLSAAKCAR